MRHPRCCSIMLAATSARRSVGVAAAEGEGAECGLQGELSRSRLGWLVLKNQQRER